MKIDGVTAPKRLFAGGSRWLDIAGALRDEPRTLGECAHVLGVTSGAIHRQLHEMLDAKLLDSSDPEGGAGTRYSLRSELLATLDAETAEAQPPGRILRHQQLLSVEADALITIANALQPSDLGGVVVWVAEFGAGNRYVLAIDRKADPALSGRLRAALESAGASCYAGDVRRVLSGPEFWRFLSAVRAAAQ